MTYHSTINSAAAQPADTHSLDQNLAFLRSTVATSSMRHGGGGHEAGRPLEGFNWNPALRSADADILGDIAPVKAKSRDLVRNYGFAKNAKRINRDNVVGPGLRLSLMPDHILLGIDKKQARDWGRMVQRRWQNYANSVGHHADVRRMRTFNQLTQTIADSIFENGEALALRTWREPRVGQTAGTTFQLVNPDRLSNPNNQPDRPGLRSGVYSNRFNEPTHYAIRETHPSDGQFGDYNKLYRWKKIRREGATDARLVMHIFDHDHVEMTRGISELVQAIKPLKKLAKYSDVTLERAIMQAMVAVSIKSELNYDEALKVMGQSYAAKMTNGKGNPLTAMTIDHAAQAQKYHNKAGSLLSGAKTLYTLPNEEVQLHRAEGADNNFDPFSKSVLREISAATGAPIAQLSQNYADANYSSIRAALLDVWRHYISKRELIIHGWCWPAVGAWLEEEVMTGAITLPKGVTDFYQAKDALLSGKWFGVGKPMIDELKERKGHSLAVGLGVQTKALIAANEGHDIEELEEQAHGEDLRELERMADKKAYAKSLGLTPEDLGESTPAAPQNTPAKPKKKSKKKELENA